MLAVVTPLFGLPAPPGGKTNAVSAVPPIVTPATGSSSACCAAPAGAWTLARMGVVVPALNARSAAAPVAKFVQALGVASATPANVGDAGSVAAVAVSAVLYTST